MPYIPPEVVKKAGEVEALADAILESMQQKAQEAGK